jgi:hypothetical protein
MGLYIGFSRSSYDRSPIIAEPKLQPNPKNWEILKYIESGKHLLVKIKYPDCTNYEGKKILLYRNTTLNQLKKQGSIDPHFSNNKYFKSPFARFEPTEEGWNLGLDVLFMMATEDR